MYGLLKQMMVDKQQQGIGSIANICYIGFVADGCSGGGGCGVDGGSSVVVVGEQIVVEFCRALSLIDLLGRGFNRGSRRSLSQGFK